MLYWFGMAILCEVTEDGFMDNIWGQRNKLLVFLVEEIANNYITIFFVECIFELLASAFDFFEIWDKFSIVL